MSDYSAKVYNKIGGDQIVVDVGGSINFGDVTLSVDAAGNLIFTGLPTVDPAVTGALWNNADVLTISSP